MYIQEDMKSAPYGIVKAENGDAWVEVDGNKMAPPQISAEILKKMKKTAEDYLGGKVDGAVVTVLLQLHHQLFHPNSLLLFSSFF